MDNSGIRQALFSQTKIGTSLADVRALFNRRSWLVQSNEGNTDFLEQNFSTPNDVLVASSLQGKLGEYGPMALFALWQFDSNNRLIDILVLRKFDASSVKSPF